jgi:hypothetical protein
MNKTISINEEPQGNFGVELRLYEKLGEVSASVLELF